MEQAKKKKGAGESASLEQQIAINAQYIKDLSFENPKAPQSLLPAKDKPSIDLNVDINVQRLQEDSYEVALKTTAKASAAGQVLFVAEVVYAGLFTLKNISEQDKEAALLIYCPNILYPFSRRIMSDVTRDGGFPSLLLDPIDFARLYFNRKNQKAKK